MGLGLSYILFFFFPFYFPTLVYTAIPNKISYFLIATFVLILIYIKAIMAIDNIYQLGFYAVFYLPAFIAKALAIVMARYGFPLHRLVPLLGLLGLFAYFKYHNQIVELKNQGTMTPERCVENGFLPHIEGYVFKTPKEEIRKQTMYTSERARHIVVDVGGFNQNPLEVCKNQKSDIKTFEAKEISFLIPNNLSDFCNKGPEEWKRMLCNFNPELPASRIDMAKNIKLFSAKKYPRKGSKENSTYDFYLSKSEKIIASPHYPDFLHFMRQVFWITKDKNWKSADGKPCTIICGADLTGKKGSTCETAYEIRKDLIVNYQFYFKKIPPSSELEMKAKEFDQKVHKIVDALIKE